MIPQASGLAGFRGAEGSPDSRAARRGAGRPKVLSIAHVDETFVNAADVIPLKFEAVIITAVPFQCLFVAL